MKKYIPLTLFSLVTIFFALSTQLVYAQELESIIVNFSFFLRNIILPLLFSIAFLYFLINMVKYFIVQGASEEGRTKAKRSAIYGIIAFVFLFSLWGIVTWVVEGVLAGTEYEESLCPDYLGDFCENSTNNGGPTGATFPGVTPGDGGYTGGVGGGGYTGGGSGGSGGGSTGGGGGSTGGGGSGGSGGDNSSATPAALAELVFGTGKDSANFVTYDGEPRAALSAAFVAPNSTCEAGLEALMLASRTETTQSAYLLYKNAAGAARWENITDLNSTSHISYDKDVIEATVNGAANNVHIVHTHPKDRVDQFEILMDGRGPSAADMQAMCELDNTNLAHVTVDWSGVWRIEQQSDTCPYSDLANDTLPLLETYNYTASVESSQREGELTQYTQSSLVPGTYKNHFSALNLTSFADYTPEEVIALSEGYQAYASTTIAAPQTVASFCASF